MRKQFVKTVEAVLKNDPKVVLLLGDIGVWGFNNASKLYPDRVHNIGILEQSTISLSAGLAMNGLIPIVHTIAPFLVERSYEQLKLDFGYQGLGGNFVSVGSSYDYAALGCSHHCPADVPILKQIPGMEIVLPGTPEEFNDLFLESYGNGHPTYFRLSEQKNSESQKVKFGKATVVQKGTKATVIAVGILLDRVLEASNNLDVTVLYYTTLAPFDSAILKKNCPSNKILVCEPYYKGTLATEVIDALAPRPIKIEFAGLPHKFFTNYGTASEHDKFLKMTTGDIKNKIKKLING